MSSIAVFLVLAGGAAFAANKLGKNTVGTKQLKNNAVTSAKIKKEAVTGAKIKLSTLGKVPSASTADTATSATSAKTAETANVANSLTPPEAVHIVGASGQPGFEGGSSNLVEAGLNLNPVGFWKDHEGVVHLQGVAKVGSGGGLGFVFTLPPGFRPASGRLAIFEQLENGTTLIAGGNTVLEGHELSGKVLGTEGGVVALDGITFRAES